MCGTAFLQYDSPCRPPPFDPAYYAAANPDVVAALGEDAAALELHYHRFGVAEGRAANTREAAQKQSKEPVSFEEFDAAYYAANNPDVVAAFGSEPKVLYAHYLRYGAEEGRAANAKEAAQKQSKEPVSFEKFDAAYYAANNPDVVAAFGSGPKALYAHYLRYGAAEGRLSKAPQVTALSPAPIDSADDSDSADDPGSADESGSNDDPDSADNAGSTQSSGSSQGSAAHPLSYTSNHDGTHTIVCSVEGCTENGHSGTADCYDVNGFCDQCGQRFSELTHNLTKTYSGNGTHYISCSLSGCRQSGHNTIESCSTRYQYDGMDTNTHSVICDVCLATIISSQSCDFKAISRGNAEHIYQCTLCRYPLRNEGHSYDSNGYCSVCQYYCSHDYDYGNSTQCQYCPYECQHPSWGTHTPGVCDECQYSHSNVTSCTDDDGDSKCDVCHADMSS